MSRNPRGSSFVIVTVGGRLPARRTTGAARARQQSALAGSHRLRRARARTVGAAVAMMQWRLRRGKRARSWMSCLHTVEVKQQQQTPGHRQRGDTARAPSLLPHWTRTRSQVCALASQLVVPWRWGRFLTHLCDVAAQRQTHQHPVCPLEPKPSEDGLLRLRFHHSCHCPPQRIPSGPIGAWCRTTMAERTSAGFLTMMLEPTPAVAMTLPAEVREKLAELELELSEGKMAACRRVVPQGGWIAELSQEEVLSRTYIDTRQLQNHRPLSRLRGSCSKTCQHLRRQAATINQAQLVL